MPPLFGGSKHHLMGVGALSPGMVECLSLVLAAPDAAQTQRRSPSPHPQDGVQGSELARIRSGVAPAWQPDLVDRGRRTEPLADLWTGRPYGCRHPDHADGSRVVQAGVAAD